ncbi:hypothetical protein P168DRAFT_330051 [Aspergillus campestris IBT 28561]|uniref:Uncharacterized protein n=1 Tax=Aspergillus campestris (strain IBT 28561) TaxID=1392248 RepID=A0A2I1CSX2_ASPC2|nr:uncharacterized protein P168DRAFT_330051 [Aspergillus campestris IBT 28561]PKY00715.1 hypothetical protein P168DRAFT_330051 [Aspergillus campestris IBT 28561]
MFRRMLNRAFDLEETVSLGPYAVVRFGFGNRLTMHTHRMFVFIPIVGLFDDKAHLLEACMEIVREGGAHFTHHLENGMVGGVLLEFVAGDNMSYEGLISRTIRELGIHYQRYTGVRVV